MRGDAKYIYPNLEEAIVKSRRRNCYIAEAIGMKSVTWSRRRYGTTDWTLSEMLAVRARLAPDMTLDVLFRREEV